MYQYQAELLTLHDGDTMTVMVDLGFGVFRKERLRLVGLNCPEMTTEAGQASREFVRAWCATAGKLNVQTVKDKREKYGRYLATLTSNDGRCLNEELLERGLAVPYM